MKNGTHRFSQNRQSFDTWTGMYSGCIGQIVKRYIL